MINGQQVIMQCRNWGANVGIEEQRGHCYLHWLAPTLFINDPAERKQCSPTLPSNISILMVIDHCIYNIKPMIALQFPLFSSILTFAPQFWHLVKALKNGHFLRPKKGIRCPQKKTFPESILVWTFCKKNGSKLVKFGPWGPIYILPEHIGGRHPVPCLSTQIAERQGTAMY